MLYDSDIERNIEGMQQLSNFILADISKNCSLDIAEVSFQVLLEKKFHKQIRVIQDIENDELTELEIDNT